MTNDDFDLSKINIEDIVIKACFKRVDMGNKILPMLTPELFTDEDNQKIISSIITYFNEFDRYPKAKELFDLHLQGDTVKAKFVQVGKIDLNSYSDDILKRRTEEFLRARLTLKAIRKTAKEFTDNNFKSINSAVEEIKEAVNFTVNTKVGVSIKKDFDSLVSYLQQKMKVVPSAYSALNGLINGGHPSKAVSMYFGEANMGKTTFLCNDAAYAVKEGYNVLYVTLEMPDFEIFKKIAANILEIPVNNLQNININDTKNKMYSRCKGDLKIIEYPSFEMSAHHLKGILNELQYKEKFTPDIVFIDYVNCMVAAKESGGQRHQDLGYIMKELENVAKEFDLPIVSCSQLNRAGYGSLEVSAKDIGESIDIIKYCANGYAIMRDSTMKSKGLFLVKILKNRYGPNEIQFYLKSRMEIMYITDASRSDVEQMQQSIQVQNVVDLNGELVENIFDGKD